MIQSPQLKTENGMLCFLSFPSYLVNLLALPSTLLKIVSLQK